MGGNEREVNITTFYASIMWRRFFFFFSYYLDIKIAWHFLRCLNVSERYEKLSCLLQCWASIKDGLDFETRLQPEDECNVRIKAWALLWVYFQSVKNNVLKWCKFDIAMVNESYHILPESRCLHWSFQRFHECGSHGTS